MTKLGVISDVHADVHALRDALAQIDRLGVEEILCCGDVVDYGEHVEETISLLRDRQIITIRGNHDYWTLRCDGVTMSGWELTPRSLAWLEALPTSWRSTIDGVRVVAWHARPGSNMHGIDPDASERELIEMLDAARADVLVVGHTHVPFAWRVHHDRMVVNPGSLLRDPAPDVEVVTSGTFAVVAVANGRVEAEIRRAATGEVVIARRSL